MVPPPYFDVLDCGYIFSEKQKKKSGLRPENMRGPKIAQKGRFLTNKCEFFRIRYPICFLNIFFIMPSKMHYALKSAISMGTVFKKSEKKKK